MEAKNGLPTQVAEFLQKPEEVKPYIIQLESTPGGLMGLDNQGSLYVMMKTELVPPRMFWQMIVKEIDT